jgi:colanic acid/amylovoran biosynthesis glycosyltransferase
MRIAFIVDIFPKLSETFILNQITGLLDQGQEVDIYARRRSAESKIHPDVEKYCLLERTRYLSYPKNKWLCFAKAMVLLFKGFPKKPKVVLNALNALQIGRSMASFTMLVQIFPFLDQGPYDIVHCHFGPNGNLALSIKEVGAIEGKVITSFYGYDISSYIQQRGKHIYDCLFKEADLFLCISHHMKEALLNLGCSDEKIQLQRLGVDINKFTFSPSPYKVSRKIHVLTIARLVEKKGLQYGIYAIANLVKKYPYIEYTIIGDGRLKNSLNGLIETLKVGEHIRLRGWMQQDEIIDWLHKADILLCPSVTSHNGDQEGTPLVIIEALARGLPVLSTWHSGIPELIQDQKSGMLVAEHDVAALTNKLEYLIKHPELWPEMGRQGRKYVEEHHDIDKLNNRLVEIYQRLLEEKLPHSTPI